MKTKILIVVIFVVALIATGCNKNEIKNVEKKPSELLKEYLLENNWKESEDSSDDFKLEVRNILDEEGKPINMDIYYLNVKTLKISRITRISKLSSTNTEYSFKSNISSGTYILLNDKDNWEKYVTFTYDFNSGTLTSDDSSSKSLCTNLSVNLKDYLEELITDANLNIEDFK